MNDTAPSENDAATFTLDIPAAAVHVGTARLFSAALGRHFGIDQEAVEDVKLGVSDACTRAIAGGGGHVRVSATVTGSRLAFLVAGESSDGATSDASVDLELLQALFDDVELETGPGPLRVRFSVPLRSDAT